LSSARVIRLLLAAFVQVLLFVLLMEYILSSRYLHSSLGFLKVKSSSNKRQIHYYSVQHLLLFAALVMLGC